MMSVCARLLTRHDAGLTGTSSGAASRFAFCANGATSGNTDRRTASASPTTLRILLLEAPPARTAPELVVPMAALVVPVATLGTQMGNRPARAAARRRAGTPRAVLGARTRISRYLLLLPATAPGAESPRMLGNSCWRAGHPPLVGIRLLCRAEGNKAFLGVIRLPRLAEGSRAEGSKVLLGVIHLPRLMEDSKMPRVEGSEVFLAVVRLPRQAMGSKASHSRTVRMACKAKTLTRYEGGSWRNA